MKINYRDRIIKNLIKAISEASGVTETGEIEKFVRNKVRLLPLMTHEKVKEIIESGTATFKKD